MRQRLLWVPPMISNGGYGFRPCVLPAVEGEETRPFRLWTLFHHTDPEIHPALPFTPVHGTNAFLEDFVHDWNVLPDGRFRYYSRVSEGSVWLLLEWR